MLQTFMQRWLDCAERLARPQMLRRPGVVALQRARAASSVTRVADVSVTLPSSLRPELVPLAETSPSDDPAQLRWLAQKESLGQDCLLLGPPGGQKRALALRWASLAGRELEYLALSSDTTEAELKQRREVEAGSVRYIDSPPVRAALHGRLLLLDGVERAERNVLPTLNNLLENREMQLPDACHAAGLRNPRPSDPQPWRCACRAHFHTSI